MLKRRLVTLLQLLALAIPLLPLLAPVARGELATWDQTRVTEVAKELAKATGALQDTFAQQPQPNPESIRGELYYELRHVVWMIDVQADLLVISLEQRDGRQQTSWIYGTLMSLARSARTLALRVFVAEDVGKRAAVVRGILNELGPFYDPDFRTLAPDPMVERTSAP